MHWPGECEQSLGELRIAINWLSGCERINWCAGTDDDLAWQLETINLQAESADELAGRV